MTDSSSSQTTVSLDSASGLLIGGGIPAMMGKLSKKPNTDSLLNFGQEGGLESSVASAHQVEVTSTASTEELVRKVFHILAEIISTFESLP